MTTLAEIQALAEQSGLVVRGGFPVAPDDRAPDLAENLPARSLVLLGNAGSSIWPHFSASAEYADGEPHPLDRWSERIGEAMAQRLSARALFPFGGPPYLPFFSWAAKAESLAGSRLGMLIHPRYGLWHAYRFALAFDHVVADLRHAVAAGDICARCETQPCVPACPVDAFAGAQYDVAACYRFLDENPQGACRTEVCRSRAACPEGAPFRYQADHAAFHTRKFFENLQRRFADSD